MADEKDPNEEKQGMTVVLTLDNDTEVEYVVLIISNAGEYEYVVLSPMEGADLEEGEVYLYRHSETEDGAPNLGSIEGDDEHEIMVEVPDELLDVQEHDELVGEVKGE